MREAIIPKSKTSRFFLFFAAWAFLSLFNVQRVQAVSCGSVPAGGSYTLSTSCNFSGTVDGVDNGGITVATGKTLTVNPGQTIVWSPGQSIIIEGSIAISSTGQLQQTYLWLTDAGDDFFFCLFSFFPTKRNNSYYSVLKR